MSTNIIYTLTFPTSSPIQNFRAPYSPKWPRLQLCLPNGMQFITVLWMKNQMRIDTAGTLFILFICHNSHGWPSLMFCVERFFALICTVPFQRALLPLWKCKERACISLCGYAYIYWRPIYIYIGGGVFALNITNACILEGCVSLSCENAVNIINAVEIGLEVFNYSKIN